MPNTPYNTPAHQLKTSGAQFPLHMTDENVSMHVSAIVHHSLTHSLHSLTHSFSPMHAYTPSLTHTHIQTDSANSAQNLTDRQFARWITEFFMVRVQQHVLGTTALDRGTLA